MSEDHKEFNISYLKYLICVVNPPAPLYTYLPLYSINSRGYLISKSFFPIATSKTSHSSILSSNPSFFIWCYLLTNIFFSRAILPLANSLLFYKWAYLFHTAISKQNLLLSFLSNLNLSTLPFLYYSFLQQTMNLPVFLSFRSYSNL